MSAEFITPTFHQAQPGDTLYISEVGRSYPVSEYTDFTINETGAVVPIPIVDIPMMSDYKWQLDCLNDRLEHPEKYAATENVDEVIADLRGWLVEHEDMIGRG